RQHKEPQGEVMRGRYYSSAVGTMICWVMLVAAGSVLGDSLVVQGQNAAGIYDTKIYMNYNDINFGGSQTLTILNSTNLHRRVLFKFTNIDTVGAAKIIDSVAIDLYCTSQAGATVGMFELWKDWYEGSGDNAVEAGAVDDNHWYHPDSAWTREAADSANDSGAQNRGNGTGVDRKATAMASVTVSAASTWYRFRVSPVLAQDWYSGAKQPYGVIFMETGNNGTTVFASSEYATATNRPKVTIYYHAASAQTVARRRAALLHTSS
ncbi:MAG: DNRLRE domain-containing protein, partial [Candidatus Zixiibacteriota bacterium]